MVFSDYLYPMSIVCTDDVIVCYNQTHLHRLCSVVYMTLTVLSYPLKLSDVRQSDIATHGVQLIPKLGSATCVNLRFEDKPATEWTFERLQRPVNAPAVYAFTVEDVFAGLQLSELLAMALAVVAQADRTDP